ncbi:hypothetical protein ACC704_38020, partial [Rhizobium johnstonii]
AALFAEKRWLKILAVYRQPRSGRSAFELAVTVVPFALFLAAAWAAVHYSFWPGLVLELMLDVEQPDAGSNCQKHGRKMHQ